MDFRCALWNSSCALLGRNLLVLCAGRVSTGHSQRCSIPKCRQCACSVVQRQARNIPTPSSGSCCLVNYHKNPLTSFPSLCWSNPESSKDRISLLGMSWMQRPELWCGFLQAEITCCVTKDMNTWVRLWQGMLTFELPDSSFPKVHDASKSHTLTYFRKLVCPSFSAPRSWVFLCSCHNLMSFGGLLDS